MLLIGYASLGLLVGSLAGLSSSPIASTLLDAVFTLAGGSMIPLISKPDAERRVLGTILSGFAVFCLAGLLGGIYLKVNSKLTVPREAGSATASRSAVPGEAGSSTAAVYLKSADIKEVNAINFEYVNKHIGPDEAYKRLLDLVQQQRSQTRE